jgi:hypothetical protein
VLSTFARKAAGASGARHSLRPPYEEGGTIRPKLARNARRECEVVATQTPSFPDAQLRI